MEEVKDVVAEIRTQLGDVVGVGLGDGVGASEWLGDGVGESATPGEMTVGLVLRVQGVPSPAREMGSRGTYLLTLVALVDGDFAFC